MTPAAYPLALLLLASAGTAGTAEAPGAPPSRAGNLYLSFALGPSFEYLTQAIPGSETYIDDGRFLGWGSTVDLKAGRHLGESFILSADFIANNMMNPFMRGRPEGATSGFVNLDLTLGVGATRYLPGNFFVNGTLGALQLYLLGTQPNGVSAQLGASLHLKAGKEWWLGEHWAMGVSLGTGGGYAVNGDGHDFLLSKGFVLLNLSRR